MFCRYLKNTLQQTSLISLCPRSQSRLFRTTNSLLYSDQNSDQNNVNEENKSTNDGDKDNINNKEEKDNNKQNKEEKKKEMSPEEKLKIEIKKKEEEISLYKDKFVRTIASVENLRKKIHNDVAMHKLRENEEFAKSLLPFNDSLYSIINNYKCTDDSDKNQLKNLFNDVKAAKKLMENALELQGIKEDDPTGKIFDPRHHNALFQIPYFPGAQPGYVGQVINSGYVIKERTLKSANVGVFAPKP